jgi:ribonuclease D
LDYKQVGDTDSLQKAIASLAGHNLLAIDVKTTGSDPHSDSIRIIQIAAEDQPVITIDFMEVGTGSIEPLKMLLASSAEKVFHNAKSTLKFLKKMGVSVNGPIFDTMLAAQILSCGDTSEPSLGSLCAKFCIPMIQTTDSEGRRPPIPIEGGHLFRVNPATLPNRKQC